MRDSVLVIGGGIAGIQAALDLADAGVKVYLVERSSSIGGKMSQLDKTFPTLDCSMCIESPKMSEAGRHPNIALLMNSEVEKVEGAAGDFHVTVKQRKPFVSDQCTGCGDCAPTCPVTLPNEHDLGLTTRKAIFVPFPQAVPARYIIDTQNCLNKPNLYVCNRCVEACAPKAIKFDFNLEALLKVDVGAIIVATGMELLDPEALKEYGYGRFPDVMTSMELERMLSANGPTEGELVKISDRSKPGKMVFVQCVGSRDVRYREYCSRVCCTYSIKEALLAREHEKDLDVTILYMDIRAYGKGFDRFYEKAQKEGIKFVRGRPSKVTCQDGHLVLKVEDTEQGKIIEMDADLVVLAPAIVPPKDLDKLSKVLGVSLDESGFLMERDGTLEPLGSSVEGVYVCGTATGPKDISESVAQASGAVSKALRFVKMVPGEKGREPVTSTKEEPRIGVFVCRCGTNIAGMVDVVDVAAEALRNPNVVFSAEMMFACSDSTRKEIAKAIKERGLNRVVIAACSPRTHESIFMNVCQEAGLNPYLLEMVNIRNQDSWVHTDRTDATGKARELVSMGVAKARLLAPLYRKSSDVTRRALVVGGGISGITAATALSEVGIETVLVERSGELGGRLRELYKLAPYGTDSKEALQAKIRTLNDSGVQTYLNDAVESIGGFVGNFDVKLASGKELEVGSIILATGADLYRPKEFGHGENPAVITNLELEKMMPNVPQERITFVACIGSRNDERGCARYCCQTMIHQALELRELGKKVRIAYRDIRTFGKGAEELYKKALEKGVLFLRYKKEPEFKDGMLRIHDELTGGPVIVPTDLLVLAVGMVPEDGLADMLQLPKSEDGFLMELHPKLGPVELATRGVFLAGTIKNPKDVRDCVSQAYAAAAKASTILLKDTIDLEPIVATVNEEVCAACGTCSGLCNYGAIAMVDAEGRDVARVNEALCRGCGVCAASCPSGAMKIAGFTDEQLEAMIDAIQRKEEHHRHKGGRSVG